MSKINNGPYAYGIEKIRAMVSLFNNCSESFNQLFTIEELAKLYDVYRKCDWDIAPHKWEQKQIAAALAKGTPPVWNEDGLPVYPKIGRPKKK